MIWMGETPAPKRTQASCKVNSCRVETRVDLGLQQWAAQHPLQTNRLCHTTIQSLALHHDPKISLVTLHHQVATGAFVAHISTGVGHVRRVHTGASCAYMVLALYLAQ